jgi:hypothetical protein
MAEAGMFTEPDPEFTPGTWILVQQLHAVGGFAVGFGDVLQGQCFKLLCADQGVAQKRLALFRIGT